MHIIIYTEEDARPGPRVLPAREPCVCVWEGLNE